jgi:hypothetical protein
MNCLQPHAVRSRLAEILGLLKGSFSMQGLLKKFLGGMFSRNQYFE